MALSVHALPTDIDLVHPEVDDVPGGRLPVIAKLEKPFGGPSAL